MLTFIQSAGVTPEVNLRNLLCAGEEAHKQGNPPWFETQGRRHQKSKIGVPVAPQKGLMSSKNFLKKTTLMKNMGPYCTVRLRVLAVVFAVALTLEPIKLEAVPLDLLWEGPEVLLEGRQFVALWEVGV